MPTKPLTAQEIAELRSKEREASSGPWGAYVNDRDGAWYVSRRPGDVTGKKFYIFRMTEADDAPDAIFIPAARNALPRLLDEVERSRALLKRIEWSGDTEEHCCPSCGEYSKESGPAVGGRGHAPDCELAALIA